MPTPPASAVATQTSRSVRPYVQIARVDHWSKNAFMVLGVMLAFFYRPDLATWTLAGPVLLAVAATCLVASSNYVLNEILDAPKDATHPEKRSRPVPSGQVRTAAAYVEWLVLAVVGVSLALMVGRWFVGMVLALWVMGVLYNVPPIRLKEWPYLDVLSESINNPIRLFLGWFTIIGDHFPPVSLAISYWMLGAFLMAAKRFSELRHIGDRRTLVAYRRSFGYYTEERLLVSMLFYACICALFGGIFIVRYKLELILFSPLGAGFLAYYLKIAMRPDSAAQHPEKLHRETGFMVYLIFCVVAFVVLMFTHMPALYDWFHVEPAGILPLWKFGGS